MRSNAMVLVACLGLTLGCNPKAAETTMPTEKPLTSKAPTARDEIELAPSVLLKVVRIEPGEFLMGSPVNEPFRTRGEHEKQHRVTLTQAFDMGVTSVTVAQFRAFVDATHFKTEAELDGQGSGLLPDGGFGSSETKIGFSWKFNGLSEGDDYPVVNVTWNDAQAFCKWLAKKSGKGVRLPTEAEREYACRAGTTTAYPIWAGAPTLDDMSWHSNTSGDRPPSPGYSQKIYSEAGCRPHPVASKYPNAWGLYDMNGNVQEWCQDWLGEYPDSPVIDPTGPSTGGKLQRRVARGGNWRDWSANARSAMRHAWPANARNSTLGFRIVVSPPIEDASK